MSKPRLTEIEFDLQLFNEEAPVENDNDALVDQQVENEDELEETEEVEDIDWGSLELNHLDEHTTLGTLGREEAQAILQKGMDYDRIKEKYSNYKDNPAYQYIDEFMKDSGFDNAADFMKEIKINDKQAEFIKQGMNEENARIAAEDYVSNSNPVDREAQEIEKFLDWQQGKVKAGIFSNELKADNIPQSVIEAYQKGTPLKEAYSDYVIDNIKRNTEQETLKKLKKNKMSSTGSVTKGVTKHNKSVNDMSKKDFETLKNSVLRGDTKGL